ncbi:MAG: YbhB/YbcL family Raf kinase inhibitor-like protein [Candidatus Heimdallarchaeota archaeon]
MVELTLTSPVFDDMGEIPLKYTCQGEEINPPLRILGVPSNSKSLVLIVEDIDPPIPFGITITHWVICHLDPNTKEIPEGASLDNAIIGKRTGGRHEYMGPCPPFGTHRYLFKLFALDEKLALDSDSRKKKVLKAMKGHIIQQTVLTGVYTKQKIKKKG